jgi:hypothetical protein
MDHDVFGLEDFFAELNQLGEPEVARRLEAGEFAAAQIPFVREWLLRLVEDRARREADRTG